MKFFSPKPRSNKQIARAGFGLSVKMLALPFIPFKNKPVVNLKMLPPNNMPKKLSLGKMLQQKVDKSNKGFNSYIRSSKEDISNRNAHMNDDHEAIAKMEAKYKANLGKLPPNNMPKKYTKEDDLLRTIPPTGKGRKITIKELKERLEKDNNNQSAWRVGVD